MTDKKILVLDIDGTLVNSEKKITPETLKYLKMIQEQGRKHIAAGIRGCQNEKTAATIRNGTHRANPARRKTG